MSFRRPVTLEEMRAHAAELLARADSIQDAAWNNIGPSAAVTGSAGRHRSGLARQHSRSLTAYDNAAKKAAALRESARKWTERADRIDPEKIQAKEKDKAFRAEVRRRVARAESDERKAAPILNRSSARPVTSAEWKKRHKEQKELRVVELADGRKVRLRLMQMWINHESCYPEVFLADKPIKL